MGYLDDRSDSAQDIFIHSSAREKPLKASEAATVPPVQGERLCVDHLAWTPLAANGK